RLAAGDEGEEAARLGGGGLVLGDVGDVDRDAAVAVRPAHDRGRQVLRAAVGGVGPLPAAFAPGRLPAAGGGALGRAFAPGARPALLPFGAGRPGGGRRGAGSVVGGGDHAGPPGRVSAVGRGKGGRFPAGAWWRRRRPAHPTRGAGGCATSRRRTRCGRRRGPAPRGSPR